MAEKKTGGTNNAENDNLNIVAEQLRIAAQLLEKNNAATDAPADAPEADKPKKTASKSTTAKSTASKSTAAKKPATKSTAAKSTASKSTAAKKPATKSTTAKSTATKSTAAKKPAAKKPAEDAVKSDEMARLEAELEAAKKAAADAEKKAAEEEAARKDAEAQAAKAAAEAEAAKKVEEPAEEVKPEAEAAAAADAEPKPEEAPAPEEQKPEEQKPEEQPQAQEAPAEQKTEAPAVQKKGVAKVVDKTDKFIKGKGKLPIFIVVNALLLLSSIMLMAMPFAITSAAEGKSVYFSLFTYFGKASEVKALLVGTAEDWANGGYAMIGILMWFAFLLPLALVIKNVIIAVRKKNFNVYKADAIIAYAFMLFYLAMVNLYGTNVTFGQMFAFIVSALDLIFVLLSQLILTKDIKSLPFFSFANILLATLTIFILVGPAAKTADGTPVYAAFASSMTGAGGFFVMDLFCILCLIALIIMQIRRLPKIVEIVVPLAAAVLLIIGTITLGASLPKIKEGTAYAGSKLAGGYVFGMILVILIAVADTLFTFLKPLKKFRKTVNDTAPAPAPVAAAPATAPAAPATQTATEQPAQEQKPVAEESKPEEKPEEKPEDNSPKAFCPACGEANSPNAAYCKKCGHRMN